jgi:hypothetical protein
MNDHPVKQEIHKLIERKEERLKQIEKEIAALHEKQELIRHAIDTLIELEHNLQLCDCPPEAYK